MGIFAVVCFATALVAAAALPADSDRDRDRDSALKKFEEAERERNAQAHYSFQADVDDRVSDLTLHRQESRDGLAVTGSFAYSDGFVRRLVKYVADENGYRVISDEAEPLDGPQGDPAGVASVRTVVEGREHSYSVQNDPRADRRPLDAAQRTKAA